MNIKIILNEKEAIEWNDAPGRERLLARAREVGAGDDVDKLEIHAGMIQLAELAPASHARLAQRLRQMNLKRMADLVDPDKNSDEVERGKIADELINIGHHFTETNAPEPK